VREMIAGVVARFGELDGASFVSARQENLETIHQHNVVAERHGTLAEVRGEIASGTPAAHQTSLGEWLDAGVRATG
jgi:GTP cyclohydrolase-4